MLDSLRRAVKEFALPLSIHYNMKTYLSHLACSKTGERLDAAKLHNLSPAGAPLLAQYDLEAARRELLQTLEGAPMYEDALELLLSVRQQLKNEVEQIKGPADGLPGTKNPTRGL